MNITMLNSSSLFALLIGTAIGAVTGYLGSLMVTKRMALMGGALGHLALPGVALALRYGFDVSIGAALILGLSIILIWLLEQYTELPTEALTALVFSSSLAVAFLFLPHEETHTALLGDIQHISFITCIITISIAIAIYILVKRVYKKLIMLSISPDLAKTQGYNIAFLQFLYLASIALMIALGVRIIGGLMTAALVAIPALTSRNLTSSLYSYANISLIAGALSCIIGIICSFITDLPVGSLIIIASTILFLLTLPFKGIRH